MSEETKREPGVPSEFSQLVIMIATSALHQLGQIADPSGKPEINLVGAQGMIDILETLSVKTKGNLDPEEQKMLTDSLTMLRLHYVEVAQARPAGSPPPAPEPEVVPPAESAAASESKTKYRKSYG
jgi:hypothetical protein